MTNELTTAQDNAPAISATERMFQSLVDMAMNPDVDADKVRSLAELQMKMMDYSKQEQFNKDKMAAIMEMPAIAKNGAIVMKNVTQSRYSKFEDMHKICMPILKRHNLVLSFNVGNQNNMVTVQPILSHVNGHVEKGEAMQLPLDTSGSKNGTQGAGSSVSYGKRHTMKAMLNIIEDGEDTDGMDPELANDAENAASCGSEAYAKWFASQSREDKIALVKGKHEDYRARAAQADRERAE